MEEIKLYTRDGDYVVSVNCLALNPREEVIFWGTRLFVWCEPCKKYKEGIAVTALETVTYQK